MNLRHITLIAAVLILCLTLVPAPAAADETVFNGGTYSSAELLATAINNAGGGTVTYTSPVTIKLQKDINITGTVKLTGPVTILGNGHTIWRGGNNFFLINVTSGTLTLGDGTSQLKVHGQDSKFNKSTGNDYGLIHVTGFGSQLIMNTDVTVSNSSVSNTLISSDFTVQRSGGGIAVSNGANFTLTGGTISGNTAAKGGGVHVWNANMTMSGGEISGNRVSQYGAGVYFPADNVDRQTNPNNNTFLMTGGKISGNTAEGKDGQAGGLQVEYGGIFLMQGGEISGNTVVRSGGGIFNWGSTMTLSGGTISGNTASGGFGGGGIFNNGGTITMTGGLISNNIAAKGGSGILNWGKGTLAFSGDASVHGNDVYLNKSRTFITVPAVFTGTVSNITGDSSVLTQGNQLIRMEGSVQASTVLGKFRMKDPALALMVNTTTNMLDVDKPMPEVASASITAYNSTAANVTFTLSDRADTRGAADGAYVNLTNGNTVISTTYSGDIAKGATVADIRLTGLTPGVSYQLNITPLNSTAAGTPRIFTYSDPFTPPVIDRIDIYNGTTKVSGTTVLLANGATQIYTAKLWNETTEIGNESVTWTSGGINVSVTPATGITTTATAENSGTERVTANVAFGPASSFTIRVLDSNIPDTLTLTANPTSVRPGNSVTLTAVFTNSSSSTRYDDVAFDVMQNGAVLISGVTGTALTWKPAAAGTITLTANVTMGDTRIQSEPVIVTVTTPTQPVPTSGDGYSSTISGPIDASGQVNFGTGTGITGVSFAKDTKGTVVLETKPTGITAPENAHAVVEISAPSFNGSAEVGFRVPLAVLRDQGLDVNDVALHHYVNGQWVKLPTFYVGEDRGAAKYVAQTTNFSPFAIVCEKNGAQTVKRSTPQPTKDAGSSVSGTAKPTASTTSAGASATAVPATSVATGGATTVPTMTQAPAPLAGMLLGLLAAVGVLIRRRE